MKRGWLHPATPRHDFFVLAPLWLMLFVSGVQQLIVAPVLPRISETLQLGPEDDPELGLIGTAFSLTLMVFALIAGAISDKIGRRKIMLMGSSAMAVTLILHAFAVTLELLILLRGLSGAAAGMLTGSFASYIGDYFPYEKRGAALGWVLSGFAAGVIIGIPAGTILADRLGYTAPFVAFGWIMVLAFGLVLFLLPKPAVALDKAPLSVWRATGKYWRLATRYPSSTMVLCYFMMYLCAALFIFFLPTWLEREVVLSSTQVASLFLVAGVCQALASPVAGKLSDKVGRKMIIVTASLCTCTIVGSITLLVTSLATAALFFGLAMTFESFRMPPMQALMSSMVRSDQRGAFFSLCNAVGQLGFGVGSGLAGWLYVYAGYVSNSIAAAVCMGLVAIVIWTRVADPGRSRTVEGSVQ